MFYYSLLSEKRISLSKYTLSYRLFDTLKVFQESEEAPHLCLLCGGGHCEVLWKGRTEFMTMGIDIWYSYLSNIWTIFSRLTPCSFLLQKQEMKFKSDQFIESLRMLSNCLSSRSLSRVKQVPICFCSWAERQLANSNFWQKGLGCCRSPLLFLFAKL